MKDYPDPHNPQGSELLRGNQDEKDKKLAVSIIKTFVIVFIVMIVAAGIGTWLYEKIF